MSRYYKDHLSAERLERCYALATPRIRQHLRAEATYAASLVRQGETVLELGCGYGRLIPDLARSAGHLVGIDNSLANLECGRNRLSEINNCSLAQMDASCLAFQDNCFDRVFCLQNGISAFHIPPPVLIVEALRIAKPGGCVVFTSYSSRIWSARLHWFEKQADAGLLGEIDHHRTGRGVIVCKDGFSATTVSPEQFADYGRDTGAEVRISEIDESLVLCELTKRS